MDNCNVIILPIFQLSYRNTHKVRPARDVLTNNEGDLVWKKGQNLQGVARKSKRKKGMCCCKMFVSLVGFISIFLFLPQMIVNALNGREYIIFSERENDGNYSYRWPFKRFFQNRKLQFKKHPIQRHNL